MAPTEGQPDPERLFAGRYRIERELGRGGMAVVYLAHDTKHDRPVALKVLRKEIAAVLGADRFVREIEVAARLNHPNILPFYDSDQTGGQLHYVMPYVEGGTLRERLAHGSRLTVDEALDIVRQTAAGLTYAHQHGVVHRDIKPANLLLSGRHVFIADFGIARAVYQAATEEQLTESGLIIGTPMYMAPEQVRGASQVDGRADVFSLASVLYEMLVGEPPRSNSHRPGSVHTALRAAGRTVPAAVEAALTRALAVDPEERCQTPAELVAALDRASPGLVVEVGRAFRRAPRGDLVVMIAAVAAILVGVLLLRGWISGGNAPVTPDTTRYAVLPFEYAEGIASFDEEDRMRAALRRWGGVEVVDPVRVREAVSRQGGDRLERHQAITATRSAGAWRYVRGSISRADTVLRITGALYQIRVAGDDSLLAEHNVLASTSLSGIDLTLATLADSLLLRGQPVPDLDTIGTRSLPAWQAFSAGQAALRNWRLREADQAFEGAATFDPHFARANLWLALVRAWRGATPARWRYAAEQAISNREQLGTRDGLLADALANAAAGRLDTACSAWRRLTRLTPDDFVAWYGTGQCETSDNAVIPDPSSPTHWRFRTSYHSGLKAYRRAFELAPAMLGSFRGDGFESARRLLFTNRTQRRFGRSLPPDTTSFVAAPAWAGDSLVLWPVPAASLRDPGRWHEPATFREAIQHQRELFRDLALTWTTAVPRSPDAREALALALEQLGDPSALDTLQSARALAHNDAELMRVAGTEVWLRIRLAVPRDEAGIRSARALADSLLRRYGTRPDPPEPALEASLAMLVGRPAQAARMLRRAATVEGWDVQGGLMDPGVAFLAFATAGGPLDSLGRLEVEVTAAIERVVPPSGKVDARREWVGRPVTLAFPEVRLASLNEVHGIGDYLADAEWSFSRGDSAAALGQLEWVARRRSSQNQTMDTAYPEAWLLAAMGLDSAAVAWLDPTLSRVGEITPQGLELTVHAGSLVRAMGLRAELAYRLGQDAAARMWARAVRILWEGGEPVVQPLIARMESMVH